MLDQESYFGEFKKLVTSNFICPTVEYFSKLKSIDPSTFLTKGKLEDVKKICLENEIEEVIFSEKLSPHQEMKLEKVLNATVYDRTHLILEIFEKQAQTEEAKIQIKIAFLNHKKTRVAGQDSHFSQQAGRVGIGSRTSCTATARIHRSSTSLLRTLWMWLTCEMSRTMIFPLARLPHHLPTTWTWCPSSRTWTTSKSWPCNASVSMPKVTQPL
jgi:50S ribosomal subunit-associated GTPase HflX